MHLLVEGGDVVAAAAQTRLHADGCRALARTAHGLRAADPGVDSGLTELAGVCADVLALVAIDLELIATRMTAGARLYDAVEDSLSGDPAPGVR